MEISFGKFKGTNINVLIEREPSYCVWLLRQKNILDKPYYQLLKQSFSAPDIYYMNWGKYKGLSLNKILEKDSKYIEWLKDNDYVNDKCFKLVEALNNL